MRGASSRGGLAIQVPGRPCRVAAVTLALILVGLCVHADIAGAAAAWKVQAVTGPTNLPPRQSEVQKLTVEAEGGTFTLSHKGVQGRGTPVVHSGELSLTAGNAEATINAVETGASFEVGDRVTFAGLEELGKETLVVSCSTDCRTPGSIVTLSEPATETVSNAAVEIFTKEMTEVTGGPFHVGDEIEGVAYAGYFPPETVVTAVGPGTLTLSKPTGDEYTVGFERNIAIRTPTEKTELSFDASARVIQEALEAMPALGPDSVNVTGGPGGNIETPYSIDFAGYEGKGPFVDQNVEQLQVNGGGLEGEHHNIRIATVVPGGPGTGEIAVYPVNLGNAPSSGEVTVELKLDGAPAPVVTAGSGSGENWICEPPTERTEICTSTVPVGAPGASRPLLFPVAVESTAVSTSTAQVMVSGAGGGSASIQVPIVVSEKPAGAGIQAFWAGAFDAQGKSFTQAGGHPFSGAAMFQVNTVRSASGEVVPAGDLANVKVDLPPGFLGNPLVMARCPQSALTEVLYPLPSCSQAASRVGVLESFLNGLGVGALKEPAALFNDVPAWGTAAEFTTKIAFPLQSLIGSVRADEDFGVRIEAPNIPNYRKIFGGLAVLEGLPSSAAGKAFLVNPTDCSVQREESGQGRGPKTLMTTTTWQERKALDRVEDPLPVITGCQKLTDAWLGRGPEPEKEEPSFSFAPTTTQGSSPTGATADLHVPQEGLTDPNKLATSDLKKAVVTLPTGLSVNPSSANGLEACNEAQVGYLGSGFLSPNRLHFNEAPVTCPDGSKLGNFTIKTPLLEEAVEGTIYLAAQDENPFNSLIALYLVVENERFGLTLKLPGEVRPDPTTGQLTATFDDNPQLPFEDLTLHFRGGGGRSTLATPETCGHFETTGSLEPWSAENGEALPIHEDGFSVSSSCASSEGARPFAPSFEAGTTSVQAGSYSPLVIKVGRKDGEQELKTLDFTLPKGLVGKLAGIPYCPEAAIADAAGKSGKGEQSSPSCPAASQIGTVDTAAGVGTEPIHVGGKVYLAGPYKGAPLSSVVVTPAVAGPFDLGDVVVRAPLYVNPESTEITAKSDPIPTILKGIPLKVRQVAINLNRGDFTLNPTSCEAMSAIASIGGSSGATASPSNRFQVGGCDKLKFKPKLKISLKGSTKHGGFPALKAVVTFPEKGSFANIARAQVNLPHSEFLEQNNLNKTCTKPVLLEGKCPKTTIYGKAKAWTPLLDKPLQGSVYLVGGYGYKLPALVAELNGQIRVVLKGKVDSGPNRGIRNTFEAVPDAPVSRFVLEMKGGKKYGLLVNSENLCRKPQRGLARFTAQNDLVQQTKPLIANQCGKKKGAKHKRKQRSKHKSDKR